MTKLQWQNGIGCIERSINNNGNRNGTNGWCLCMWLHWLHCEWWIQFDSQIVRNRVGFRKTQTPRCRWSNVVNNFLIFIMHKQCSQVFDTCMFRMVPFSNKTIGYDRNITLSGGHRRHTDEWTIEHWTLNTIHWWFRPELQIIKIESLQWNHTTYMNCGPLKKLFHIFFLFTMMMNVACFYAVVDGLIFLFRLLLETPIIKI